MSCEDLERRMNRLEKQTNDLKEQLERVALIISRYGIATPGLGNDEEDLLTRVSMLEAHLDDLDPTRA